MNIDDNKNLEESIECDELCFGYDSSSDKEEEDLINNEGKFSESMEVSNCSYKIQEVEKKLNELSYDDMWGIKFDTVDQCCDFYRNYARVHGFVARLDEKGQDFNGNLNMRQIICNREGTRRKKYLEMENRKKDHKPITRVMCQAKIRFHYDLILPKWRVTKFEETHNDDLIPPKYIQFVPAYRTMTDADKAQADSLHFMVLELVI
ncbi:protein FAR1-RELATED SEQUENCE 11-like [Arachis duranensis]|uniref:Protein FAR1-RELATED SEQUENCE 11-like n=1 Tax=Arachis duranensis TaxID=130453 RepID=A0A6P4DP97_ARADU|nr:protein FAR1-RELATED SEQUENCE 11-like [Arachis duranensis]